MGRIAIILIILAVIAFPFVMKALGLPMTIFG